MTAPRPLRADARRNRERLLDAAEAVFTEKGAAASTEEVARRAGVGIGTVFRHFPTKEALLAAVHARLLDGLAERARTLLTADDPGAAFHDFTVLVVSRATAKNALADALAEAGVEVPPYDPESHKNGDIGQALAALLRRAQQAGAVRPELTPDDLIAVLIGVSRAVEHAGDGAAGRERVTTALLSGLRPPPPPPG